VRFFTVFLFVAEVLPNSSDSTTMIVLLCSLKITVEDIGVGNVASIMPIKLQFEHSTLYNASFELYIIALMSSVIPSN
jgi:hypothetical protein